MININGVTRNVSSRYHSKNRCSGFLSFRLPVSPAISKTMPAPVRTSSASSIPV